MFDVAQTHRIQTCIEIRKASIFVSISPVSSSSYLSPLSPSSFIIRYIIIYVHQQIMENSGVGGDETICAGRRVLAPRGVAPRWLVQVVAERVARDHLLRVFHELHRHLFCDFISHKVFLKSILGGSAKSSRKRGGEVPSRQRRRRGSKYSLS